MEWIALTLAGALVVLDTTALLQIMVSQPLVSGVLAGAILGNIPAGGMVGLVGQLLWLRLIPVGGALSPRTNLGAYIAAASTVLALRDSEVDLLVIITPAIGYGMAWSLIGGWFTIWERRCNARIVDHGLRYATLETVGRYQIAGLALTALWGGGVALVAIAGGRVLLGGLAYEFSAAWEDWLRLVTAGLLGIGLVTGLKLIWDTRFGWLMAASVVAAGLFLLV